LVSVSVNRETDPAITLILPVPAIIHDEDVEIEVLTMDFCEERDPNSPSSVVALRPNDFDWRPDGIGRGAYFGAVGEGAPSSEPVYQQLGICESDDVDSRWNRVTQRFETSDQYRAVQRLIARQGYKPGDPEYRILQGTSEDVG